MVNKGIQKAGKRDKPTMTKKALERLVTINNGGPINNFSRSGSEEPEFSPSSTTSTLTSRPKDATPIPSAADGLKAVSPGAMGVEMIKKPMQKPNFDFKALMSQSGIGSQLPGFLEQMRAANAELEAERRAGTIGNRKIEIDDTSSEDETSSSGEDDSGEDENMGDQGEEKKVEGKAKGKERKQKKERGQYIEMNLGLGVLEEKNSDDETSSSGSENESGDENMGVMDRLQGTDKEEIEARKKAKIEVVKET